MQTKTAAPERGFSLVEIAIVLVIIGTLMIGALKTYQTFRDSSQRSEVRGNIQTVQDAIVGYAIANNRLPLYNTTTDEYSAVGKSAKDPWGNPLIYIYEPLLSTANTICGRKTTSISVNQCNTYPCTTPVTTVTNVAFLLISRGKDYVNQTGGSTVPVTASPNGGPAPTTPATINVYEPGISVGIFSSPATTPAAYDDFASMITLDELRQKAGCSGVGLRITNNEMPFANATTAYSGTIYADGGVGYSSGGKYKWCIQTTAGTTPIVTGLTFAPTVVSTNCAGLAEASWSTQADSTTISGTPTVAGSYSFTIFVRDNNDAAGANDNVASKTFVLTVNPS
jgi:prepilin-type N-terminal cleavage/methylation domain-containing protein